MGEIKEKKKGGKLKTVLIVVAIIIVIGALGSQNKDEPKKVDNSAAGVNNNDTDKNSDDNTEEEDKPFTVGDSVELNDVTVTFNGVTESTGSDYNAPSDGNVYVLAEFTIENNSDKELTMSTMLSFDAYQDGFSTTLSLGALMEKGNLEQLDGSIAAGKKMKGVVGYEVPSDYKELEINIQLSVWSNKKITFVYNK